jgi:hypothetical protein
LEVVAPGALFEVSAMRVVWVLGGAKPGDNNFADVVG